MDQPTATTERVRRGLVASRVLLLAIFAVVAGLQFVPGWSIVDRPNTIYLLYVAIPVTLAAIAYTAWTGTCPGADQKSSVRRERYRKANRACAIALLAVVIVGFAYGPTFLERFDLTTGTGIAQAIGVMFVAFGAPVAPVFGWHLWKWIREGREQDVSATPEAPAPVA